MSDIINDIHNELENIDWVCQEVKELCEAFNTTGCYAMSEKLYEYHEVLKSTQSSIRNIVRRDLSDRLDEAKKSAASTLSTVLEFCESEKKKESD
jgi:hypothetical protein